MADLKELLLYLELITVGNPLEAKAAVDEECLDFINVGFELSGNSLRDMVTGSTNFASSHLESIGESARAHLTVVVPSWVSAQSAIRIALVIVMRALREEETPHFRTAAIAIDQYASVGRWPGHRELSHVIIELDAMFKQLGECASGTFYHYAIATWLDFFKKAAAR